MSFAEASAQSPVSGKSMITCLSFGAPERVKKSCDLVQECFLDVYGRQETEQSTELELCLELSDATHGDSKEVAKFATRVPTVSFGDIRRDGNCSPAHLRTQTEALGFRQAIGQQVNRFRKLHRLLPHDQFFVSLHENLWRQTPCHSRHRIFCLTSGDGQLATVNG